jgi:hypothetical protein
MTTYTATNDFHSTSTPVTVIKTYKIASGWAAEVADTELHRAHKALCPSSRRDCICTGPHALTDEQGRVYGIVVVE